MKGLFSLCAVLGAIALGATGARAGSCEDLATFKLLDTTITSATPLAAGAASSLPEVAAGIKAMAAMMGKAELPATPALCRVTGVIRPTADSNIKFELWLPSSGWNGKFWEAGGGGLVGYIAYSDLIHASSRGYAAASTDTGHEGAALSADWARGHPEKVRDWADRGVHLTTMVSKAIVAAFYAKPAQYSYFSGCSNGGRQGLIEAQQYPDDFDGIIAGAPGGLISGVARSGWIESTIARNPAGTLTSAKLAILHRYVVKQCDSADGVTDGLISNPAACHVKLEALACKGTKTDACLSADQITTARRIYAGIDGAAALHGGLLPGSELEWRFFVSPTPQTSMGSAMANGYYGYVIYNDPTWTSLRFDLNRDIKALTSGVGAFTVSDDPDMFRFASRGGKLIIYSGMSDPIVPMAYLTAYLDRVHKVMGTQADPSVALFLVPGMGHCGGADGFSLFNAGNGAQTADTSRDVPAALQAWVETGSAPKSLLAQQLAKSASDAPPGASLTSRTRPVCAYPKAAHFTGGGSSDDAANFVCR